MLPQVTDWQLALIPKYTLRVTLQFVATCVPLVENVKGDKEHMFIWFFSARGGDKTQVAFRPRIAPFRAAKYMEKLMAGLIQLNI